MKKAVFALAALASVSLHAMVASSNTLCWIAVSSPLTNTIVSTSLIDIGLPATESVDVGSFVLTNNLSKGDLLLRQIHVDGVMRWQSWCVADEGWVPTGTTIGTNTIAAAESTALPRAAAFLLRRLDPSADKPFYICGQVSGAAREQATSEAWTLMSNASIKDVYIDEIPWKSGAGPVDGDVIAIPCEDNLGSYDYTFKSGTWNTNALSTVERRGKTYTNVTLSAISPRTVSIPAGTGFWLKKKTSASTAISWSGE